MATRTTRKKTKLTKLDVITASLVPRQSKGDDESYSIEDQVAKMKAYCAAQTPPIEIGGIYPEREVSGRRPLDKRPGLLQAVEDVENGKSQMVLTAYFDRLARSTQTRSEVVNRVEAEGGVVMTLDMGATSNATAASKLQGTLMAAIAEFYADQVGEKVAVTIQRNIDNGIAPYPSVTPAYVKREDGTLEQHPTNGPLFAEACRMRAGIGYTEVKSWTAIARWLNEQGVVDTKTGEPLHMTKIGVRDIILSKLMVGEIHFGDFEPNLRAIDDPVCSRSTYRMIESAAATRGRYSKSERLLARQDVLFCGSCDARMSATSTTTKRGHVHLYYRCTNTDCTDKAVIGSEEADDAIRDKAIELSKGFVGRATLAKKAEAARVAAEDAQKKVEKAIRILALADDEDEAKAVLDELQENRDKARAEYNRLKTLSSPGTTVRTARDWEKLSLDGKRGVIRATILRATVTPDGRRGTGRLDIAGRTIK